MNDNILPTKQNDDFFTILTNAFKLISRSWEALVLNLGTFIAVYFLPLIIFFTAGFLAASALYVNEGNQDVNGTLIIFGIIAGLGIGALLVLLTIASIIAQLASVRGKKISFKEAVDQAQPFFWRFLGLGILSTLAVLAGLVLLIIPGLVILFWLMFAAYIMVDKNTGIKEAMKASVDLTKKNWKVALALVVVQLIIQIPSSLIPFLGGIASTALSIAYFCLPTIIYLRISGSKPASAKATPAKV